ERSGVVSFLGAKLQAVAQANLRVASSLGRRCRPCGQKGKAAVDGMGKRRRSIGSPGVAGAACNGREAVQCGRSTTAAEQNRQPVRIRRVKKGTEGFKVVKGDGGIKS